MTVRFADFLFPKQCVGCGRGGKFLCDRCLSLQLPASQVCIECERPSVDGITHYRCKRGHGIDGVYCLWRYDGVIRKALISLKYRFAFEIEEEISKQVVRSVIKRSVVVSHNPIFTCVPLHISRERWRGFNQAGILAMNISKSLGCRFFPDLVVRKKKTTPQVGLGKRERSKNLRDVFEVNVDEYGDYMKEKIIIFDDVVTTGTTMKEMAKALKKAGFDNVWGLAVAR